MLKALKPLLGKIGVDGAIAFTVLSRLVQACGGLISIVFIARFLNSTEQGYYYTFASIIAIQVFFELGLSGIITQYAAHEFAHLSWQENNRLAGDDYYKSRLASLLQFCVKWFGAVSAGLFLILIAAGIIFFSSYNKAEQVNWYGPWIVLCAATSLNLFIDPVLAFYEGLGEVKDMATLRLIQRTLFIICLFAFLALGFKLYASPLASVVSILVNYCQLLFTRRGDILKTIWRSIAAHKINYAKEIFPYQWRLALSWISSYFIFQLFNPVLFATQGAKAAGQMGMTLQALNGLSALSMSWINTKVPLFSAYIAKRQYAQLDGVFDRTVKQLSGVNLLGLLFLVAFVFVLNYLHLPLAQRFVEMLPLLLLCLATFSTQFIFSWSVYLRCHKQEPFLVNSIVIGVLCAISTFCGGWLWGLNGIVAGYTSITLAISLPWAYFIFRRKKTLWHN